MDCGRPETSKPQQAFARRVDGTTKLHHQHLAAEMEIAQWGNVHASVVGMDGLAIRLLLLGLVQTDVLEGEFVITWVFLLLLVVVLLQGVDV